MSNGPPTPPATTPAELQDEVRLSATQPIAESSASAVAETSQSTQSVLGSYQNVFPGMIETIARNDYQQLVKIAEHTDHNTPNDRHPSRLLIVAPMVLGHLILDDLTLARYALVRLPESLASLPLSRALMSLVVVTMNRNHAAVYDQAISLQNLVLQPDFFDKDLATVISGLLEGFIEHFRQRTFKLLSKAYTSLPVSLACTYLSLPQDQTIHVAQENSWSYDASSETLRPEVGSKAQIVNKPPSFSSLSTFHFVTDSVAKLEG